MTVITSVKVKNVYKKVAILFLAALFTFAGVMHFVRSELFVQAMPDYLPEKLLLTQITGIAEIAGAAGLLVRKFRRISGICLAIFLVCVFPVNIDMALHPEKFPSLPIIGLWLRLPLQALFIWATLWCSTYKESALTFAKRLR